MACVDPEASIKAILNSVLNYLLEALVPTLERISIIVIQEKIYNIYLKVFQGKCTEIQVIIIKLHGIINRSWHCEILVCGVLCSSAYIMYVYNLFKCPNLKLYVYLFRRFNGRKEF